LGTSTDDFIQFIAEDSGNVALDGNFSIQVISKALETFQLVCESILHESMSQALNDPLKEKGFICNLENHWLAIRNLDDSFWDLNSLLKRPSYLSELYLGAYLKQLQMEGYNIFVVRGVYPMNFRNPNDPHWAFVDKNNKKKQKSNNDDDLQRAIEESMIYYNQDQKNDQGQTQNVEVITINDMENDMDYEMELALKLSMQTESQIKDEKPITLPEEPVFGDPNSTKLVIRLPDGEKIERRFSWSNKIEDIYNWIKTKKNDINIGKYKIIQQYPKLEYKDLTRTIEQENLKGNCMLLLTEA